MWRRGGLGWVPYTSAGQYSTQVQYQPNYVSVAVPQTSYMPQLVQQQIPYQTTRYENQVVQQQVPVQVTRVENQVVEQQVPVQVQKMEAVQEKRVVPYSVQRPVTTLVENKVPVQKVQWVQEQHVRPVTVQRQTYKLETVTEEVPIRTYSTERVVQKVKTPVRVARRVPVVETRMVPKTVTSRIPLDYFDPYAGAIVESQSTWMPVIDSALPRQIRLPSQPPPRISPRKVIRPRWKTCNATSLPNPERPTRIRHRMTRKTCQLPPSSI